MDHLREVRSNVNTQLREIPFVRSALNGATDRDAYIAYLSLIANQYARHSPKVMALAASRCTDSHPEFAKYLFQHATEEQPHNEWAFNDLRDLGVSEAQIHAAKPVPSCAGLIAYSYFAAERGNPVGIFGWMYVLEAVGSDLGNEAGRAVQKGLGLVRSKGLRFVKGHGAADQDHIKDIEKQIRRIKDGTELAEIDHVADVVAALYVRMFLEVDLGLAA